MKQLRFLLVLLIFVSCQGNNADEGQLIDNKQLIAYSVNSSFLHSTKSFTEGLTFYKNHLYESTGSPQEFPESESIIGVVDLSTGIVDEKVRLDKSIYFGEGIVFLKDKLFQLTYKNQTCFVYDAHTFKKLGRYSYANKEGWGLTTDSTYIIMSDGTDRLTYLDADNFAVVKSFIVSDNGYSVQHLNELEYINGYIYANIWTTNEIVKIDPVNGQVIGKLDLSALKNEALQINSLAQETNGIAYNAVRNSIYVTGKFWPRIYEIKLVDNMLPTESI